jgi:hypothetical protein
LFVFSSYGLFLTTSNSSTAPMITITMIIAVIAYKRVLFEAKSDTLTELLYSHALLFDLAFNLSSFTNARAKYGGSTSIWRFCLNYCV